MPGAGERFDIVVVGVQGDDGDLAADLSALTGLSATKVSIALSEGELIVHRSLTEPDARRAASSLRRLGAQVEIRAEDGLHGIDLGDIASGSGFPGRIPDIDESPTDLSALLEQGRTPAPIAPPPEFGGAASTRNIDIGGRGAAAPGLVDPSRPHGRIDEHASERPFAPAFERATSRDRPTPRDGPAISRDRPRNGEPKPPREPYVGTPRRAKAEAFGVSGQIADAQRLAASLEAAAESDEAITVVTLDGQSTDSVEIKLGGAPGVADTPPEPPPRRALPDDDRLALDLGAPREPAPASQQQPPPPMPPPQRATVSGPHKIVPATSGSHGSIPAALVYERRRLFSADPVANYLFGVAIGLAFGVVLAFGIVRMSDRDDAVALEAELATSFVKPIEVESGELRSPDAIQRDLDALYGGSRKLFLLTMFLIGIPAGFGLGFIKR